MEFGTLVTMCCTFLATRLVSYLKKRSMRFVRLKSSWISLAMAACSVALIYLFAPGIYAKETIGVKAPYNIPAEILASWLLSAGVQASKNNITNADKETSSYVYFGGNSEVYQDFINHAGTIVVPFRVDSSCKPSIDLPIEYYFRPCAIVKEFVEQAMPFKNGRVDIKVIDWVLTVLSSRLRPYMINVHVGGVVLRTPGAVLVDPPKKIDVINYTIVEHAVLSALCGPDMVRTVYDGSVYYNIFRYGDRWLSSIGFVEEKIEEGKTYIGHRGVIHGRPEENFKYPSDWLKASKKSISDLIVEKWGDSIIGKSNPVPGSAAKRLSDFIEGKR